MGLSESGGSDGVIDLQGLDHVALAVRDPEASARWYARVLGLERAFPDAWGGIPVFMLTPEGSRSGVALFPIKSDPPEPRPARMRAPVADHLAFRVDRANYERAKAHLAGLAIPVEEQDHVVAHSLYFQDPDGHRLELTTYEVPASPDDDPAPTRD